MNNGTRINERLFKELLGKFDNPEPYYIERPINASDPMIRQERKYLIDGDTILTSRIKDFQDREFFIKIINAGRRSS